MSGPTYVLEFGMGVDLHGEDCTKAACRAVFDALRHSSLPLLREIRARGGEMVVDVVVAVPDPASVDLERVKRSCLTARSRCARCRADSRCRTPTPPSPTRPSP